MRETNHDRKRGATPRQLALIGVLAAVFVTVLVVQFGGEEASTAANADLSDAPSSVPTGFPRPEHASDLDAASAGRIACGSAAWPIRSLDDVLRYNPFAVPDAWTEKAVADTDARITEVSAEAVVPDPSEERQRIERQERLEQLVGTGVTAVVGTKSGGYVAVIGSQAVRRGDLLNGFRVIAIGPDGIELESN